MRMAKRPFTLMEILLVVALIGLTFGAISFQFPKALRKETFEQGVDQVKTRIALAQELMLNYQTDVVLKFSYDDEKKGMRCFIQATKPLSDKLKRSVNRNQLIKGIEEVAFEDSGALEVDLHFDGTLGATPRGRLVLKGHNREAILTLKGFPSHILRGDHVAEESQATYPEEIISFI